MAMRKLSVWLVGATLLCSTLPQTPAFAKPPELPVDRTAVCEPDARPVTVFEAEGANSSPEKTAESTCPFLQQQEAVRLTRSTSALFRGVLENLENLDRAQELCRAAERARKRGLLDEAARYYEEVRKLCPGSRYDTTACERLQQLAALRSRERTTAETEEEAVAPPREVSAPNNDGARRPDCPMCEPSGLLRRVLETMTAGQCTEVDATRPDGLRVRCTFQIGLLDCRLIVGSSTDLMPTISVDIESTAPAGVR